MYSGYCSLHPKHHTSYQDISCGFCFPSFILRTRLCLLCLYLQDIPHCSRVPVPPGQHPGQEGRVRLRRGDVPGGNLYCRRRQGGRRPVPLPLQPGSALPKVCPVFTIYRDGNKAWLFAKLQPGRARKRINAT